MDNQIHIPLDLADVRINQVSKTEAGAWLIQVESTRNETLCRKCGQPTRHFHGWDEPLSNVNYFCRMATITFPVLEQKKEDILERQLTVLYYNSGLKMDCSEDTTALKKQPNR